MAVTTEVTRSSVGSDVGPQGRTPLWERPLTVRTFNPHKDRPMRLEEHFVDEGCPVEHVTEAVHELRRYRREKADTKMVFENGTKPTSHRFSDHYARKKYAQAMDAARILEDEWSDVWTVMLTLTAYEYNANNEGRAYADHLHDLLASNNAVMSRLRYHLREKRGFDFGRLSVIQPHDNGYAHIQHGLWIDGRPDMEDDLYPAIEAHLNHCPVARKKDHPVAFDGSDVGKAIRRFKATPENDVATGLVTELAKDLVGFNDNLTSDDGDVQRKYERLGATLMATNVNQWRPDRGVFQDAVSRAKDEYEHEHDDRGEYKGVRFEEDGEVYDPADLGGKGGGVTMLDVTDVDPNDDPIPRVD